MRVLNRSLISCFLLIPLLWASPIFAKKVKIEWKPIEGAPQYEIQVQSEGRIVLKKILEDPQWKGELPPGTYSYQIRGVDRANRPGIWTELIPLAVMPSAPRAKFPPDGKKVELFHPDASLVLRWEEVPGAKKYNLDIKKDGRSYLKTTLEGTRLEVRKLPAGKYTWTINAVLSRLSPE